MTSQTSSLNIAIKTCKQLIIPITNRKQLKILERNYPEYSTSKKNGKSSKSVTYTVNTANNQISGIQNYYFVTARKTLWISAKTFFFEDHLFLAGKTSWICDFGQNKPLNFDEDLFFCWRSPNFHWKIASNQFKINENLGQVRLRLKKTSKKPPPPFLWNPGYAPANPTQCCQRLPTTLTLIWKELSCLGTKYREDGPWIWSVPANSLHALV